MNRERMKQVFANYIEKFEMINDKDHDENYKWRIAYQFPDLIDPDSPLFASNLKQAATLSSNLIDSTNRYCFSALVTCAEKEPDSVRALFKALFADDGGDLQVRQNKILTFIEDAYALTTRLHTSNGMYMNDQRSAMAYLFLNDPEHHYLYKSSEANNFASCIEFYDDWGSGSSFRLDIYHRMCDALVEEIQQSPELLSTHNSRFYDCAGEMLEDMHPDNNYHILAFDIIYGAPEFRYNFYKGIPYTTINAQARKLHEERTQKANALLEEWKQAKGRADLLTEAQAYFAEHISVGTDVKHRTYGEGRVTEAGESQITVHFPKIDGTKKFSLMSAFTGRFLTANISDLDERIAKYQDVAKSESSIFAALDRAEQNLAPYREYLE